jgi:predicted enzyme related to lactoylglutathione lyase
MPRVTHFDIPADDPERAMSFWKGAFGWEMSKWDGPMDYWMIMTGEGEGIDGGMSRRDPSQPMVPMTIDVPDIDEYIARVEKGGGKMLAPKYAIPGVGWFAPFQDTEGNVFGIMEADERAR